MTDTLTAAKAAQLARGEPYWVETQFCCLQCGGSGGRSYRVIGPDDTAIGCAFDVASEAAAYAEALNAAYVAGRTAGGGRPSQPTTREQRRYQIARAVLAALYTDHWTPGDEVARAEVAIEAVLAADALLAALGKEEL